MNARALVPLVSLCAFGCVEPLSLFDPIEASDAGDSGDAGAFVHSTGVTAVSLGWFHSCAVREGGLWCWGDNAEGELGVGDLNPRLTPARVGSDADWASVSAGYDFTCALKTDGRVACWGNNAAGQLGAGDGPTQNAPAFVPALRPVTKLSSRYGHSCAIVDDGTLWCWGENTEGQLGLDEAGTPVNRPTPQAVLPAMRWLDVSAGQGHTCGVRMDGELWCWGRNTQRQLGLGAAAAGQVRTPTRVGTDTTWAEVVATAQSTCARKSDGTLFCWGTVFAAMPARSEQLPVAIAAPRASQLSADLFGACALDSTGESHCWGRNTEGQLGTGDVMDRLEPTLVGTGPWLKSAVGRFHRCVTDASQRLWCVGEGAQGRLGTGTTARSRALVPVTFGP